MIVDSTREPPRVLMGRRHGRHVFMPGVFVFPGGRLEPDDRRMTSATELRPHVAERLGLRTTARARGRGRALALAAIRETWEETGLMLGRRDGAVASPKVPDGWRDFAERGVLPDLARIDFVGRAITPPGGRRRFDTRFFTVDREAIAFEAAGFAGPDREFVELTWADLRDPASLDAPVITRRLLSELVQHLAEPGRRPPFFHVAHGRCVRAEL